MASLAFETLAQGLDPYAKPKQTSVAWTPNPGPQAWALDHEADELYYGGQAGGGKTDLVIGAAATRHWKSVIFRRQYVQLSGIIDRSRELLQSHGTYNDNRHLWRLGTGQRIELGACDHVTEVEKWQGRDHDLKAFDELCHFTEAQFLFLTGWNRSTKKGQRCRIVATFNPPTTPEGRWVVKRLAAWLDPKHPNPAKPGDLRWFVRIDGEDTEVPGPNPIERNGETLRPRSRTFIPAALSDNPALSGTAYEAVLDALPEPLRSQLKYGKFGVEYEDDPYQVIPSAWIKAAQAIWTPEPPGCKGQTALGVDPSRGGDDKFAIAPRHAAWFAPVLAYPGKAVPDGPAGAALVIGAVRGQPVINVDVIGIGSSVYDQLKQHRLRAIAVNVAEKSAATDRSGKLSFANLRAEAWWKLREMLDPVTGQSVALPPDDELLEDLSAPRWTLRLSGIQIEPKDDIRERIGRSPDKGDAVVLASFLGGARPFAASSGAQRKELAQTGMRTT